MKRKIRVALENDLGLLVAVNEDLARTASPLFPFLDAGGGGRDRKGKMAELAGEAS